LTVPSSSRKSEGKLSPCVGGGKLAGSRSVICWIGVQAIVAASRSIAVDLR
jgi:hypothetical protein